MSLINSKGYISELSFKNKLSRFLWAFIYTIAFRTTPRPMHAWRVFLLRCFGADIEKSAKVYASARIWAPWNLILKEGAILGDRVDCYCVAPITIGKKAVVSQDSFLCAATHDHRSMTFTLIARPIYFGDGAWIAARAFVGPGVSIGINSVVGACAVVFKDVPAQSTAIGNPCRILDEAR